MNDLSPDTTKKLGRAVERGAELLSLRQPGWYNLIDLDDLSMADCHQCVCGQLYNRLCELGEWQDRTDDIDTLPESWRVPFTLALLNLAVTPGTSFEYGFDVFNNHNSNNEFEMLHILWREKIEELRKDEWEGGNHGRS